MIELRTEEEQQWFFSECFTNYGRAIPEDMAANARLIFARPPYSWLGGQKIIVEYKGKRHFYPASADLAKSLDEAADTLVYEYVFRGTF